MRFANTLPNSKIFIRYQDRIETEIKMPLIHQWHFVCVA
ncbi:hypothetical protein VRK_20610 [Vibrio sp. MEBiC08052]|nr:hypothetical protein VRK_20610 [Vibrio sp. MEBiC08052]